MKFLKSLIIVLLFANYAQSQETKQLEFIIDSLVLDNTIYFPVSINNNIQSGKSKYNTILETDSLDIK